MSEMEQKPTIQPPVLTIGSRMLRSPSHESVTTDLSLFSVSSTASDMKYPSRLDNFKSLSDAHLHARIPSPNPESRLQVQRHRAPDIPEILWFEEDTELIRSCGVLSSALGLQKSFSTSDVSQLPSPEAYNNTSLDGLRPLRSAVSAQELDLAKRTGLLLEQARLEHSSRSCSTWVAVGDISSMSQLPSPHGGASSQPMPTTPQMMPLLPFTAADLVRSVNKKVRQNYIRRRLMTTYRALERLSQSEFNLDRLEAAASAAQTSSGTTLLIPGTTPSLTVPSSGSKKNNEHSLTAKDVERQRGKQLSKYERNMMIFNWLHTLDDSVDESNEDTLIE